MSKVPSTLKTFRVYRIVDGEWKFWMNARGKSAKQLHHSIWWHRKSEMFKEHIHVEEPPAKPSVADRALARLRELAEHVEDGGNVTDQFKVTTVKIDDDGTVNRRVSEPATKRPHNRAGERREP